MTTSARKNAYHRILKQIRRGEHTPYQQSDPFRATSKYPRTPIYLCKNGGSTIAALSGSTISSGTVTIWEVNGTTISASSDTITAFNSMSSAVGANKMVFVAYASGEWFVIAEAC